MPTELLGSAHFGLADAGLLVLVAILLVGAAVLALAETALVRTNRAKALALASSTAAGRNTSSIWWRTPRVS